MLKPTLSDVLDGKTPPDGIAKCVQAIATAERGPYIDSSQWFCVSNMCPAFVGTAATKKDSVHISSGTQI